jgi:phenylacetate-coenzyme A ligase PaaK-like adenylate-forming protein
MAIFKFIREAMLKEIWQKTTLNGRTYSYLRKFRREAQLPAEQVREIRLQRLKATLCNACQNHPFYRERFEAGGFDPFRMRDADEIKKIPVLQKEEYRSFIQRQVAKNEKRYRYWYRDGTSGSSGMPLHIFRTWEERAYMSGKWMQVLMANDYHWRDVTFSLPSPRRVQRDSIVQRFGILRRYTVAFTSPVEEMVSVCRRVRPTVVYGYKSHLVQMALYCEKNKIELHRPHLCISVGETMDERSKAVIGACFGIENLIDAYGVIECGIIAWQRKREDHFRISHTTTYLEVLDEKGKDADSGHGLLTDLFIGSFPLIRYKLGDFLDTEIVNGLRVIRKIKGRMDDWIIFADGERMPYHAFYLTMEKRSEIRQFRVIQETYDHIRIQLVPASDADPSELEKILLADLKRGIRRKEISYTFDFVDQIPPDPSGKIRMLISKISSQ